jgi:hypothetical protein
MSIFFWKTNGLGETVILSSINRGTTTALQFRLWRRPKDLAIAYYSSQADLTLMATIMQASDNYSLHLSVLGASIS